MDSAQIGVGPACFLARLFLFHFYCVSPHLRTVVTSAAIQHAVAGCDALAGIGWPVPTLQRSGRPEDAQVDRRLPQLLGLLQSRIGPGADLRSDLQTRTEATRR